MDSDFENEDESESVSSWMESVRLRYDQLSRWSSYGKPKVFWLSGFHSVSRFLMALKQSMAKRQSVAIQQIEFEFNVINNALDSTGKTLQMHPKQGAYVHGLYLRGAAWDCSRGTLCELVSVSTSSKMDGHALSMDNDNGGGDGTSRSDGELSSNRDAHSNSLSLYHLMPVVHFKPVVSSSKFKGDPLAQAQTIGHSAHSHSHHHHHSASNVKSSDAANDHYRCPLYDAQRHLLCYVALKTIHKPPAFWTMRGTALLLHRPQ